MALKIQVGKLNPQVFFEQYLDEQQQDKRICLVAFIDEKLILYLVGQNHIRWISKVFLK